MQLTLDGKKIEAACGETLLTLIRRAGFYESDLAKMPLASMIGGEVFH